MMDACCARQEAGNERDREDVRQAMKAIAKTLGANFLGLFRRTPDPKRVAIFCYHSIHPTKSFASADPMLFEEHLAWFGEHCDVISLDKAMERCHVGASKRPAIVITFDDGYGDNYDYAFPLLTKYRLPATFFVTTGFIDRRADVLQSFERARGCHRADIEPLSWNQILEMQAAGFQFGSHTVSHPNLLRVGDERVRMELRESKGVLQQQLARKIDKIAYPFGKPGRHLTERTVALAADVGYTTGAAVLFRAVRVSDSPLRLPRFYVTRDSVATLAQKIAGSWDFLGWWTEEAPDWAARLVSPADFRV
jgi:peptidoglycan/xylan/chitin deacetylase (PgdA/CDA1 family)